MCLAFSGLPILKVNFRKVDKVIFDFKTCSSFPAFFNDFFAKSAGTVYQCIVLKSVSAVQRDYFLFQKVKDEKKVLDDQVKVTKEKLTKSEDSAKQMSAPNGDIHNEASDNKIAVVEHEKM